MVAKWIETLTGPLEQKKQYREAKGRIDALPAPYATAANAMHRYVMYYGGVTDGETLVTMVVDLADLWERALIDATPVRAIVGDDPIDFVEDFVRSYEGTRWIDKERARLAEAMDQAEKEQGS